MGKPGSSGPPPKRSEQRRRRNKPEVGDISSAPSGLTSTEAPFPPSEAWHPIAAQWFQSLALSGQSVYFEHSDWSTAYYVAELMSRGLSAVKPNGQIVTAVMSGMSSLLSTEGDRRRMRIELARADAGDADEDASVTAIAEARGRFTG